MWWSRLFSEFRKSGPGRFEINEVGRVGQGLAVNEAIDYGGSGRMMGLASVGILCRLRLEGERTRVFAFPDAGLTMSCRVVSVGQGGSCTMLREPRADNAERRRV